MRHALRQTRILAADALRDAVRSRLVWAVGFVSGVLLLGVDSCTGAWQGTVDLDGQALDLSRIGRAVGVPAFVLLGGGVMTLAGLLGADALARPLRDGTADLVLARPVGRSSYALARLAGALGISFGVGAALLGAATWLLHQRQEASLLPALAAAGACALGACVAASFAMTISLFLTRVAASVIVLFMLGAVALANCLGLFLDLRGTLGALDRFGPPLFSSVALAVARWAPSLPIEGDFREAALRLAAWLVAGLALLLAAARRVEVGRD